MQAGLEHRVRDLTIDIELKLRSGAIQTNEWN
jgi:hypothetical protein